MQLLGALLERAERLLKAIARGLKFQLPQLLLDRGLALAILFLGHPLLAETLLFRPELLLDQVILGCPTPLFSASEPIYRAAISTGYAEQDTGAVCAVLEAMAGIKR